MGGLREIPHRILHLVLSVDDRRRRIDMRRGCIYLPISVFEILDEMLKVPSD